MFMLLLFTPPHPLCLRMFLFFPSILFIWSVCVGIAPSLSLCVCVFVFTERPKECVWWGDIGCIGAPRAQEETQMCAAMRCSYLFFPRAHTLYTCIHTSWLHTCAHTHPYKVTCHNPLPLSLALLRLIDSILLQREDKNENSPPSFR